MKKLVIASFLLASSTLFAQWNYSPAVNNPVCTSSWDQANPRAVSDGKGGVIVAWEDYRLDSTKSSGDIYAQRISAAGNVMWTVNGVSICSDAANQTAPVLVEDSAGGAIIVWQDERGTKRNLYAQRIDSSGNVKWTVNGVGVTLRNYDQKNPKLLADHSNGAIVLWQDSVGSSYDIYAQRLDGNGTALWPNGVAVCAMPLSQVNPKGDIDAGGNIFITWQDKRNGSDYDIYAQKIDLSGIPQWSVNGLNFTNVAGTQSGPKIVIDNAGGAIIAWQDKRNGLDYDVYAQRVTAAGVAQWGTNGTVVSNATGSQSAVDLTSEGISSGAVITWKDSRNGSSNLDIYAQLVDQSGTKVWTANGVAVTSASASQLNPNITTDGSGGVIIAYQDSTLNNWDIRSQRVSASGVLMWNSAGVDVGVAGGNQINHKNIYSKNGTSIYVFEDKRNGSNYDIYAYKIDANGAPVFVHDLQKRENVLHVYPNPSNGPITFNLNGIDFGIFVKIEIFDAIGDRVSSEEMKGVPEFCLKNKLSPGVYTYRVSGSARTANGKFIIQD